MPHVLVFAYVAGLVVLVGCGIGYPRWRWPLLVTALRYVAFPVLAAIALVFLLSRGNFQFG